jgi:hypothetical protein
MITKEQFLKYLDLIKKYEAQIDKVYNDYRIELWETTICDSAAKIFDLLLEISFTKEGVDLINWWLYESSDKQIYENDEAIDISVAEDFWNYLITNKDIYIN